MRGPMLHAALKKLGKSHWKVEARPANASQVQGELGRGGAWVAAGANLSTRAIRLRRTEWSQPATGQGMWAAREVRLQ